MSIDKYFKITIISIIIIEVISLLSFKNSPYDIIAFLAIIFLALILSLKKIEYGLFILLAELFVGGKGYLFSIDFNSTQLSIRMGLFLVIIGVWLYQKYKNKQYQPRFFNNLLNENKILSLSYVILTVFIGVGLIKGLLQNDFSNTFFDFNAWIYFVLFIIFIDQIKSLKQLKQIASIFFACIFWLSLKTIIVLFLFSHAFTFIGDGFYKWIRDTGVGEITYISGNIYRVFFQSHIFVLLGFFVLFTIFIYLIKDKKIFEDHKRSQSLFLVTLFTILISTTLLISQSRSFWLAGLVTFTILIISVLITLKVKKNILIGLLAFALILGAFDSAVIYIITQSSSIELITARASNPTGEAASSSRINQLQPLFKEIKNDPVIGSGFGATATYKSSDPRILSTHPDGMYTTYAFEWGYLDIWLKIGLLGLLAYLFWLSMIFKKGISYYKTSPTIEIKTITLGLLFGLIALIITNVFTPYLNHPLGIGYLLLLSAVFTAKEIE